MKNISFANLFKSQDSRYTLKTAFLVTMVPLLMLAMIIYSIWLLVVFNHSYFIANGMTVLEHSREDFMFYILQSQMDYLPYLFMFFVVVFFLGMFLAYVVLRPFNQIQYMCEGLLTFSDTPVRVDGLNRQKIIIKIGQFLYDYHNAKKTKTGSASLPKDIEDIKGPALDKVFYFQFICIILILTAVTLYSVTIFTGQLYDSIVETAVVMLKAPKGMALFLSSQKDIIDLIIYVPCIVSCVLYGLISQLIIARIQGVTYAYVRDIKDVAKGNTSRRVFSRLDDPGHQAAEAINKVLDYLHPETVKPKIEVVENTVLAGHPRPGLIP
jgi:hypothetical protein